MKNHLSIFASDRFAWEKARILLAAAILSVNCAGPRYTRPPVTTPDSFREAAVPGAGWKKAEPADTVFKGAWWELYGDSLLDSFESRLAVSNQSIAAAAAQYRQARALVRSAASGYFPVIGGQASYLKQQVQPGSRQDSGFTLEGTVSWEPDIWGKVTKSVQASRASAQATAAQLAAVVLSMRTQLAQDYFALRILDVQKHLLDSTVADYRSFLDLTNIRAGGGIASSADVALAKTQLATAQAQAIDLGVQRGLLEHAVATLLGIPASQFSIAPDAEFVGRVPLVPLDVPSALIERRPDIAAAEREVAAANAQIGVARTAWFPSITLSGDAGNFWPSLSSGPGLLWSLGGALAQTIFNGGQRLAQVQTARAAYEATVANYRGTVLSAFEEVEDYLSSLRILQDEAGAQDTAVSASRLSVELTLSRYKAGIASSIDVINTSTIYLSNRKTAIGILGNRLGASVLLIKALGGGWNAKTHQAGPDKPVR